MPFAFMSLMFASFVLGLSFVDTNASTYKSAEDACMSMKSHVVSFDSFHATCENTAVINHVLFTNSKKKINSNVGS